MRGRLLAASRAICGCVALAAGVAGCGTAGSSSVTVSGKTLTIYASAPSQSSEPQAVQDVLDAEQLALQGTSAIGSLTVKFAPLHGKPSDNARTAIRDTSAIAYLGEAVPAASADSLGITNALDLLQVSPSDTALELTQPTAAVPGSPGNYYEALKTYGRTFARVVPNTAAEAKAQVQEMRALGVTRLYSTSDGSDYGHAFALSVRNAASAASLQVASSRTAADGVFYAAAAGNEGQAARTFNTAVSANPKVKLFGSSTLDDGAFVAALSPAAQRSVSISSAGQLPGQLSSDGRKFVSDFTSTYHRTPGPDAIFGYEAMKAVLAVLSEAGSQATNRATVVHDFFAIKNRTSVLGTYSINAAGDTSLGSFVFSHVRAGKLVPFKAVSITG